MRGDRAPVSIAAVGNKTSPTKDIITKSNDAAAVCLIDAAKKLHSSSSTPYDGVRLRVGSRLGFGSGRLKAPRPNLPENIHYQGVSLPLNKCVGHERHDRRRPHNEAAVVVPLW